MWESQAASELMGFTSTETDPRLQPDPVVLAWIADDLRVFWRRFATWGISDHVARTITTRFIECLRGLDALPREDPFWNGTNRRPTRGRMGEFCVRLLGDDPADPDALTMAAAYHIVVAQSFSLPIWRGIREAGVWEASWSVYAALDGYDGGYDTVADLVKFLREQGSSEPALLALDRLMQSEIPWVVKWAERVVAASYGADFR
jgi:hypothetical protein